MFYTLFSPSEGKNIGGEGSSLTLLGGVDLRRDILQNYNNIILNDDQESIKKLFGFKKFTECEAYIADIFHTPTLKAIQRYDGVAYDYLRYNELNSDAQNYIDKHTIIFSNLFGPIKADDMIPIYKVKQGNSIGDIKPELYYKERFSSLLDEMFEDAQILDLRAGYYEKFYKVSKPYTTLKFLKGGKVVSHWAKAYRGIVLRQMAKEQITSLDDFAKLQIPSLICEEIKQIKNKTEIIYSIVE
ncbi:UPF0246 protein YaaA [hydrothermal vent metagenome]|uniref:UPF0246 protein YaaA n=1 Tax=hydrothermal vent metagenome TaxID=652676 RepID=A0A1W1BKM9_9ZZZZ